MPKFRVNVKTSQKGPIFDKAKTKAAATRMIIAVNEELAMEGVNRVKARLSSSLQNPTGYYESNIQVERRAIYRGVTDNNVPYGGWLEGVDSRNKTTRFKGYKAFRLAQSSLNQDKERIAEQVINKMISELT